MDPGDYFFWKWNDKKNNLLLTVYQDNAVCFYLSNSISNDTIPTVKSKKQVQRDARFSKLEVRDLVNESGKILDENDGERLRDRSSSDKKSPQKIAKKPKKKAVDFPRVVHNYATYMKGVDKFNKACSYYQFEHSSHKWYRSIFIWLFEVALNNSYYLYQICTKQKTMNSLDFRMKIIKEWQREFLTERLASDSQTIFENSESEIIIDKKKDGGVRGEQNDTSIEQIRNQEDGEGEEEQEEDECRLIQVKGVYRDCNICSKSYDEQSNVNRVEKRKRTNWICGNNTCQLPITRKGQTKVSYSVCPECFHIHIKK